MNRRKFWNNLVSGITGGIIATIVTNVEANTETNDTINTIATFRRKHPEWEIKTFPKEVYYVWFDIKNKSKTLCDSEGCYIIGRDKTTINTNVRELNNKKYKYMFINADGHMGFLGSDEQCVNFRLDK